MLGAAMGAMGGAAGGGGGGGGGGGPTQQNAPSINIIDNNRSMMSPMPAGGMGGMGGMGGGMGMMGGGFMPGYFGMSGMPMGNVMNGMR